MTISGQGTAEEECSAQKQSRGSRHEGLGQKPAFILDIDGSMDST